MRCSSCGVECGEGVRDPWGRPSLCNACFNLYYAYCAECGRACERHIRYYQNDAGEQLCSQCWAQTQTWRPTVVPTSGPSTRVGSPRCFGLELETSACPQFTQLRGRTVFGAKQDCSVDGMEFDSPILQGNRGLDHVRQFCRFAQEMGFQVDSKCGFHIHLDMRHTTKKQRRAIIYAYRQTYKIWESMVAVERRGKHWCQAPDYSLADVLEGTNIDDFCSEGDRYEFVNLFAYECHSTFEIRGYQGTLNAPVICNWIKAHLRFVDAVQDKSFEELDEMFGKPRRAFRSIRRILGAALSRFYSHDWRASNLTRHVSMV